MSYQLFKKLDYLEVETEVDLILIAQYQQFSSSERQKFHRLRNISTLLLSDYVKPYDVPSSKLGPHAVSHTSYYKAAPSEEAVDILLPCGQRYCGGLVDGVISSDDALMDWTNGVQYRGEFSDGMPSGRGRFSWPNGDVYTGQVSHGLRHGCGHHSRADGSSYCGQWMKGRRHGRGMMRFADGGVYNGEWCEGHRSGMGHRWYRSGVRYTGEWKNGLADGSGVMKWVHADTIAINGRDIWYELYRGQWCAGIQHGTGVHVWARGRLDPIFWVCFNHYCGQFVAGERHGSGVFTHSSGTVQKSVWVHNKMVSSSADDQHWKSDNKPVRIDVTEDTIRSSSGEATGDVIMNVRSTSDDGKELPTVCSGCSQNEPHEVFEQRRSHGLCDENADENFERRSERQFYREDDEDRVSLGSSLMFSEQDFLMSSANQMHLDSFLERFPVDMRVSVFETISTLLKRHLSRLVTIYQYYASRGRSPSDELIAGRDDSCTHNHCNSSSASVEDFCLCGPNWDGRNFSGRAVFFDTADSYDCDLLTSVCAAMTQIQWWHMLYESGLFCDSLSLCYYQTLLIHACGFRSSKPNASNNHPLNIVRFGQFLSSLVLLSANITCRSNVCSDLFSSDLLSNMDNEEMILTTVAGRLECVLRSCICPRRPTGRMLQILSTMPLPQRKWQLDSWYSSYQKLNPVATLSNTSLELAAGCISGAPAVSRLEALRLLLRHHLIITAFSRDEISDAAAIEVESTSVSSGAPVSNLSTGRYVANNSCGLKMIGEISFLVFCEAVTELCGLYPCRVVSGEAPPSFTEPSSVQIVRGIRIITQLNRVRSVSTKVDRFYIGRLAAKWTKNNDGKSQESNVSAGFSRHHNRSLKSSRKKSL